MNSGICRFRQQLKLNF